MDTTQPNEVVLKTDVLGRMKTPASRREQLLDEFERSGLSGAKYAGVIGVKYSTFATWAQKRRRARAATTKLPVRPPTQTAASVRWLEAVVQEAQHCGAAMQEAIILELRGGGRVEISHTKQAALAAALLRELEKPC